MPRLTPLCPRHLCCSDKSRSRLFWTPPGALDASFAGWPGVIRCAGAVAIAAAAQPSPPDVESLLQHLDDLYRSTSSIARMEIRVVNPRTTRTLRLKAWTRGEEEVFVLIEAPPREAGTATLRVGQNLWNYLPRIARTIRVPPSAMLRSWMGTDLTNDDLVKESSLRKDFSARIDRRSEAPKGWWLALDVRPGVVGRWSRIEILVSDDRLPVEERHFDRKGRLARTMTFDEVGPVGGRRVPTHIVLGDGPNAATCRRSSWRRARGSQRGGRQRSGLRSRAGRQRRRRLRGHGAGD